MQAEEEPARTGWPDLAQGAERRGRRYGRWLAFSVAVLVVLGGGLTVALLAGRHPVRSAAGAPSTALGSVPSPVPTSESPDDRVTRMRQAVVRILHKVAPDAVLDEG